MTLTEPILIRSAQLCEHINAREAANIEREPMMRHVIYAAGSGLVLEPGQNIRIDHVPDGYLLRYGSIAELRAVEPKI